MVSHFNFCEVLPYGIDQEELVTVQFSRTNCCCYLCNPKLIWPSCQTINHCSCESDSRLCTVIWSNSTFSPLTERQWALTRNTNFYFHLSFCSFSFTCYTSPVTVVKCLHCERSVLAITHGHDYVWWPCSLTQQAFHFHVSFTQPHTASSAKTPKLFAVNLVENGDLQVAATYFTWHVTKGEEGGK